jgi:Domain of unknown function (DUF3427)
VETDGRIRLARADGSGALSAVARELIDWRLAELGHQRAKRPELDQEEAGYIAGPVLWASYMREDIPKLFGKVFNPGNWNSGIVRVDNGLVLLTTLNKGSLSSGNHYEDRFLSPTRMQWQSQTQTRQASKIGEVLSGKTTGGRTHLFVRASKLRASKAAPFLYCGQPRFIRWEGEAPITIEWELPQAVPEHLRGMLGVVDR